MTRRTGSARRLIYQKRGPQSTESRKLILMHTTLSLPPPPISPVSKMFFTPRPCQASIIVYYKLTYHPLTLRQEVPGISWSIWKAFVKISLFFLAIASSWPLRPLGHCVLSVCAKAGKTALSTSGLVDGFIIWLETNRPDVYNGTLRAGPLAEKSRGEKTCGIMRQTFLFLRYRCDSSTNRLARLKEKIFPVRVWLSFRSDILRK